MPLDKEAILNSVKKTNKLLIVHEDTRSGGIAGEIAAHRVREQFSMIWMGPFSASRRWIRPCRIRRRWRSVSLPGVADVVRAARDLAQY